MNSSLRVMVAALALCTASGAWAATIFVKIDPRHQQVKQGDTPRFAVKITANEEAGILMVDTNPALRENYAKLYVMQSGKNVDVPEVVPNPRPVTVADYKPLAAGQSVAFVHDGAPLQLAQLRPGKYSATLSVPVYGEQRPVYSNVVTFEVVAR